jgi:uncharacterized membrane protein
MRTWIYSVSYDESRDDFFAMVDDGAQPAKIAFSIDSTEEMINLLKNKTMTHIDDTVGLKKYLVDLKKIDDKDMLFLDEYPLW